LLNPAANTDVPDTAIDLMWPGLLGTPPKPVELSTQLVPALTVLRILPNHASVDDHRVARIDGDAGKLGGAVGVAERPGGAAVAGLEDARRGGGVDHLRVAPSIRTQGSVTRVNITLGRVPSIHQSVGAILTSVGG